MQGGPFPPLESRGPSVAALLSTTLQLSNQPMNLSMSQWLSTIFQSTNDISIATFQSANDSLQMKFNSLLSIQGGIILILRGNGLGSLTMLCLC